jgi:hypothetical protein
MLVDGHARNLVYQRFGHSANLRVPLPARRRLRGALRPAKRLGLDPKVDAIPYRQITQLADNVKNNLPKDDKVVYRETFNSIGPTGSAKLANSARLSMKLPAFSVPRSAPRMPRPRVRVLWRNLAARVRFILRISELGH